MPNYSTYATAGNTVEVPADKMDTVQGTIPIGQ